MKILSVLILFVVFVFSIEGCELPSFVKETCRDDNKWMAIAGIDGAIGKPGKRGKCGLRGKRGRMAKLCFQITPRSDDLSIRCSPLPYLFEKLKKFVRDMAKKLDRTENLDLDGMTKKDLIKIILNQKDKIADDKELIGDLEEEIKKLKDQLKDSENALAIIKELKKQLKQKVKENAEKDAKIKKFNDLIDKLIAAGNDNLKGEIKKLKATVADLRNKLAEVKDAAGTYKKLHDQIKKLHEDLKEKTKSLEDEVARLKKQLLNKGAENLDLKQKIKKLEDQLAKARKACDNVKAEKEKLVKKLEDLKKKCEENSAAQKEIIDKLKKQIDDLKEKHKGDLDAHKKKIKELEDQIKELENAEPKFSANSILCSGDETKAVTSVSSSSVGVFSKYKKKNIELPCMKATDGSGPWFVLLNRQDGSVDFKQNFKSYQNGFGNQKGEFWLGLDAAHALTSAKPYRLRVELEDHKGNKHYALYKTFSIGGGTDYRLKIGDFEGDIWNALKYSRNQRFSTFDKDQDGTVRQHCAHGRGGWWYKKCSHCLLTGKWSPKWLKKDANGIRWRARGSNMYTSYYSWKKARMLIQPKA